MFFHWVLSHSIISILWIFAHFHKIHLFPSANLLKTLLGGFEFTQICGKGMFHNVLLTLPLSVSIFFLLTSKLKINFFQEKVFLFSKYQLLLKVELSSVHTFFFLFRSFQFQNDTCWKTFFHFLDSF